MLFWPLFAMTLVVVGALLGLAYWASWVSSRYGAPRWLRAIKWIFGASAFVHLAGNYWSYRELSGAIDRGTVVDATDRARLLANGIAEAMYNGAIGVLFAIVGMLVMLVLTWRYHWSAKLPIPMAIRRIADRSATVRALTASTRTSWL